MSCGMSQTLDRVVVFEAKYGFFKFDTFLNLDMSDVIYC